MSESKVSITWARAWSSNSTTCRASGQVTAHRLPSASNARLETRRFWSRLYWVNVSVAGSKISTPLPDADVDLVGLGVDGQGQGDAVAELVDDRAGGRVELQERAAAGRRPEMALVVEGQRKDLVRQRGQRRARPGRRSPGRWNSSLRAAPPLTRKLPSGAWARAIGPRMPSLWAKPVANDCAWNGCEHRHELGGRCSPAEPPGTPCCAWVNSGLVEGCTVGAGGMPKLGGVVLGTVGSAPRLTRGGVLRHVGPGRGQFVVAGHVGRQRQERVRVAGLALVDHRAGGHRHLVLPDLVGAAVLRDVQRHVL